MTGVFEEALFMSKKTLIALIAGGVALLVLVGVLIFLLAGQTPWDQEQTDPSQVGTENPEQTETPTVNDQDPENTDPSEDIAGDETTDDTKPTENEGPDAETTEPKPTEKPTLPDEEEEVGDEIESPTTDPTEDNDEPTKPTDGEVPTTSPTNTFPPDETRVDGWDFDDF